MRGFQLFTTGILEVPSNFRKMDLNNLTTKNSHPLNDQIYVNMKKAEIALGKLKSDIFKAPNTNGKGFTTFAETFYLMEVDFDKETNKVDHYICIWAYAPHKKDNDYEDDF